MSGWRVHAWQHQSVRAAVVCTLGNSKCASRGGVAAASILASRRGTQQVGPYSSTKPVLLPHSFQIRWDANYEAVSLADVPHRRLTRPVKVLEQFFDGERKARGR